MKRSLFVLLVFGLILSIANLSRAQVNQDFSTVRGRVLEVQTLNGINLEEDWETQEIKIRLSSGLQKNQTITLTNTLTGHPFFDLRVKKGDRVLLQVDQDGGQSEYYLADYSRQGPLLLITGLFALIVTLIGGFQGFKALISLVVMVVVIIAMILPLILKGYNPVIVTIGLSSLLTGGFIFFVNGKNKKTLAAICGTIGGLIASGLLAFWIGNISYLTGLSSEEAQMLQFMNASIDLRGLLFSGMIIGALGAILDVGISIASAMEQIKEANPETDLLTLFSRGLRVGKDLIATMSNTLILAYLGSSLPLLLLFQLHQNDWIQILNLDLVASEIVRAMVGSIGLTLAIPITAVVAAFLLIQPQNKG